MNKSEFIQYLHKTIITRSNLEVSIKDTKHLIDSIIKFIELHYVSNEKLIFKNFGVFYNRFFNSSTGLDPINLCPIKLNERYVPSFKLSKGSSFEISNLVRKEDIISWEKNILPKDKLDDFYTKFYKNSLFSKNSVNILIQLFVQTLKNALVEKKKITFSIFCSFEIVHKNERMGRNPKTMEPKVISARNVIKFVPSRTLRYRVRKRK